MPGNEIRKVRNYDGMHIGMLGIDDDIRFPVRFTARDHNGHVVCVGCTTSRRHGGCMNAWAIIFYDNVHSSEFN